MILFHGSDIEIANIDLERCRPHKDFGKGFYMTEYKEHAETMARRAAHRNGTSPLINKFEFDIDVALSDKKIKVCYFLKADKDWAEFVYKNREIQDFEHDFDIVIGPIADDGMAEQFALIKRGIISMSELSHRLRYKEDTIQYCFLTEQSLKYLKKYD